jgi:hypothetical protein
MPAAYVTGNRQGLGVRAVCPCGTYFSLLGVPVCRDETVPAGAGGNGPLLFVIVRSRRRRGNLIC